jgi:hypothetical protein
MEEGRIEIGSPEDYQVVVTRICSLNEQLREHVRTIMRDVHALISVLESDIPGDDRIVSKFAGEVSESCEAHVTRVAFYTRVRDDLRMFHAVFESISDYGKIFGYLATQSPDARIPNVYPFIPIGVAHRFDALLMKDILRTLKHVNACIRLIVSQPKKTPLTRALACRPWWTCVLTCTVPSVWSNTCTFAHDDIFSHTRRKNAQMHVRDYTRTPRRPLRKLKRRMPSMHKQ